MQLLFLLHNLCNFLICLFTSTNCIAHFDLPLTQNATNLAFFRNIAYSVQFLVLLLNLCNFLNLVIHINQLYCTFWSYPHPKCHIAILHNLCNFQFYCIICAISLISFTFTSTNGIAHFDLSLTQNATNLTFFRNIA